MNNSRQVEERVVVTGLGVVSSLGVGKGEFWKNITAGKSGVGELTTVRADQSRFRLVGEVKNFDFAEFFSTERSAPPGRTSRFASAAAQLALRDAGLHLDGRLTGDIDPDRVGVVMGTTTGEQQLVESVMEKWIGGAGEEIGADSLGHLSNSVIATNIADLFGFGGYSVVLPAACSGGNYAIAHAFDLLRSGKLTMALAGGADCLSRHFIYGFSRLGALAPQKCQPFDKNRKGIIPGEGSGVLVLETLRSAMARRAHIYSEVLGYGISSDAHHPVAPDPKARGAVQAMRDALAYSGVSPRSVQYISAHGTGTAINDVVETVAIKEVFGDLAYGVPVSSIKSMLGHPASAASALESIACNLVIEDGVIPPTINYEEADPDCDLDYVPNVARRARVDVAMNNSYAFLGSNASVIFGRLSL